MTTFDFSAARWCKSSRSDHSGECVEVASVASVVAVRDSKDPDGPKLIVDDAQWRAFTRQVRRGAYDM
jgi:hypothetical protein